MDYIAQFFLLGTFLILGVAILFLLPMLGEAIELRTRRKRFKSKLNDAYQVSPPPWKHVLVIADQALLRNTKQSHQIKTVLKNILSDVLVGSEEYSDEKVKYLDSIISQLEDNEPFEGIPDNLVLHLQKIKETLEPNSLDIVPLVKELQELSAERIKEKRNSKIISAISLTVTVLSFAFAIYVYSSS